VREKEPTVRLRCAELDGHEGVQSLFESRHCTGISVGESARQAVQQQLGRARPLRRGRLGPGGPRYLGAAVVTRIEAGGGHGRGHCVQVVVAGAPGVKALKLGGCSQEWHNCVAAAVGGERDLRSQLLDLGAQWLVQRTGRSDRK
jgi:hypothetical protein